MSEKEKKYFWLKLPRNFYGKHYIKILRSKENDEYPDKIYGELLTAFYLWMLTESIDHDGTLRYSEKTPYNAQLLASASGFSLHFVTLALQEFTELELLVTESDGTLFLPKSLKMIGSESASAQRVRDYRNRKKEGQENAEQHTNSEFSDECYSETASNNEKQNCNTENKRKESKSTEKDNKKAGQETTLQIFERLLPNYSISDVLADRLRVWFKYKMERKEPYKETGMKSLLTQICKHTAIYGDCAMCNLIDECMANGWKGIIWDKLKHTPVRNNSDRIVNRVSEVDNW